MDDVVISGLSLVVFADWYNVNTMAKMRFFDDNTRSWWTPVTGGANIPALNDLLAPFGIAFGDRILNGDFKVKYDRSRYASGSNIVKFPRGGYVHSFPLFDRAGNGPKNKVLKHIFLFIFQIQFCLIYELRGCLFFEKYLKTS